MNDGTATLGSAQLAQENHKEAIANGKERHSPV